MMHFYEKIRPMGRQVLSKIWPGPPKSCRRIAVVGMPRSGTSWLAKAISLCNGVSYYFEPDQQLPNEYLFRYVGQNEKDELLRQHIEDSFRGRISDEYTIAEQSLADMLYHPFASTVLVKWVRLCLSLDWVAKHFPDVTIVQIIRHPVPLFLSWKARGWDPAHDLALILHQRALMEGPLKSYASVMQSAKTYWEKAGALWGAVTYMQWQAHRPNWFFRLHEWYCYEPEKRIRWLAESLGLEWSAEAKNFLSPERSIVRGPGYGGRRDSRTEINKWIGKIKPDELDQINKITKIFDLPFFKLSRNEDSTTNPFITKSAFNDHC